MNGDIETFMSGVVYERGVQEANKGRVDAQEFGI